MMQMSSDNDVFSRQVVSRVVSSLQLLRGDRCTSASLSKEYLDDKPLNICVLIVRMPAAVGVIRKKWVLFLQGCFPVCKYCVERGRRTRVPTKKYLDANLRSTCVPLNAFVRRVNRPLALIYL